MRWFVNGVYLFALVMTLPYWLYKAATAGKYRTGMWRKLTGAGSSGLKLDDRPVVWFHAVSVGEVLLLRPLLHRVAAERPDLQLVLSTTTETGYAVAEQNYPELPRFFAPFDFSWAVDRTFDHLEPVLLVLAELEIWPNLVQAAKARAVPVAVVNARMGVRSHRGYRRFRRLLGPVFRAVSWWGAQTEAYAERIGDLVGGKDARGTGALRIQVTGSIKYDGAPIDRDNAKTNGLRRLFGFRKHHVIWVAGSTQGPEDDIVLDAFRELRTRWSDLRLVLVPRHRERFEEAAAAIAVRNFSMARRSELAEPLTDAPQAILVDTVGELAAVWGLADVGFVGGSLDGVRGGQSMIEPAGYGVPVCFGPHVWNFRDTVDKLLEVGGAVQLAGGEELFAVVDRWLSDRSAAAAIGMRARDFILSQKGAVDATMLALQRMLPASKVLRRCA